MLESTGELRLSGCSLESTTIQRASSAAREISLLLIRLAPSRPYSTSSQALRGGRGRAGRAGGWSRVAGRWVGMGTEVRLAMHPALL